MKCLHNSFVYCRYFDADIEVFTSYNCVRVHFELSRVVLYAGVLLMDHFPTWSVCRVPDV